MGQAQINVRTRACSRTSIARTRQAALTHNVRGKELKKIAVQETPWLAADKQPIESPPCSTLRVSLYVGHALHAKRDLSHGDVLVLLG